MSDSLWPHGIYSPWNSLGQNTGVGSLSLLQGIFPIQESNRALLHWRRILYQLSYQSYGFSRSHTWMWELDHKEGWTLKNSCFWGWCWRRLLRVPSTARRSNQSILKEISSEYSLEGLIKLWPPDAKNWLFGKDPAAGKDWRWAVKGKTEDEMVDGITALMHMSLSRLWELVMDREGMHAVVNGVAKSWTWLSNWTELRMLISFLKLFFFLLFGSTPWCVGS